MVASILRLLRLIKFTMYLLLYLSSLLFVYKRKQQNNMYYSEVTTDYRGGLFPKKRIIRECSYYLLPKIRYMFFENVANFFKNK